MPPKKQFVMLTNGAIVPLEPNNRITVTVSVELAEVIKRDLEQFLDYLSELATMTPTLSDISYEVVGHSGNTLHLDVSGEVDLADCELVDHEQLPEQEFEVQVTRVGYGQRTVRLSAKTFAEARDMADDDAGNHTYSEHHADYQIEVFAVHEQVPA